MTKMTVAELLIDIGVNVDDAEKAQKKVEGLKKETEEAGNKADKAESRFAKWGKTLRSGFATAAKAAGAAVGAVAVALGGLVLKKTEAMDATNKLAASLGTGVEELQRLQFAASQSGLDAEKLKAGVQKLNTAVLDLESGTGAAKQTFAELGIGLEDLKGKTHTQQLGLIADRLNEIDDAAERSAMAARIFGEESGPKMASLLGAGSQGILDLMEQTKGVFSQEDADRASAFRDRLGEVENMVSAMATGIAADLLPTVADWVDKLQTWYAANEELIQQGVENTIAVVAEVLHSLWIEASVVVDILKALHEWMMSAERDTSKWSEVLKGLLWAIKQMLSPLQNLRTLAGEVAYLLSELGIISMRTADEFNRSIGLIETSSQGLDVAAERYRNLADAADQSRQAMEMHQIAETLYGKGALGPVSEEEMKRGREKLEELKQKRESDRAGIRAAAAAGPIKPKKKEKEPTSSLTLPMVWQALLGQDPGILEQQLGHFSAATPSVKDVKPTIAMDITINNTTVNVGGVTQHIASTDPAGAGRSSAAEFRRMLRQEVGRAANNLIGNTIK